MKVLVTGGAGYIGSHTVRQLVKTGADVTVLDNMVYGHAGALVDPEVKLVKGDLGDASVVYPLLMKGNFDAVIHFADRKSTRLNSSHIEESRMPSSA